MLYYYFMYVQSVIKHIEMYNYKAENNILD